MNTYESFGGGGDVFHPYNEGYRFDAGGAPAPELPNQNTTTEQGHEEPVAVAGDAPTEVTAQLNEATKEVVNSASVTPEEILREDSFTESMQADHPVDSAHEGFQVQAHEEFGRSDNSETNSSRPEQHELAEEDGVLFEAFGYEFLNDLYSDKVKVPYSEDPNKRYSIVERPLEEKEIIINAAKEIANSIDPENASFKGRSEVMAKLDMLEVLFGGDSIEMQMDRAMKDLARKGRAIFDEAEAIAGERGGAISVDGPVMTITYGQELKNQLIKLRRERRAATRKEFGQD